MKISSDVLRELLIHASAMAEKRDDPLLEELVEAFEPLLLDRENFERALKSQGLPEDTSLEDLIKHHRGNAATAAGFQLYADALNYEPSSAELEAAVAEVYGPDKPEEWQLDNAKEALRKANRLRFNSE